MPLGPALAMVQRKKVSAPAGPDYTGFGTLTYENRNASGLTIPFTSPATMTASGSLAVVATWTNVAAVSYYAAGSGAVSAAGPGACMLNLTTGALRARHSDGTTLIQPASSASQIVSGAPLACLMSWQSGGTVIVRAKASQVAAAISAVSSGANAFVVGNTSGAAAGGGLFNGGFVYHVLVYSTVVDLAALQTALNSDWGTMSELLRHGLMPRISLGSLTALGYEDRVLTSTAFGDLVAWVKMDGNPPTDTIGNLAPGVVIGGVTFVAGSLPDPADQIVANFNGTTGYLSFADDVDLHLSAGAFHFPFDLDAFPPLNEFRDLITKEGLGVTDQDFVIGPYNNAGVQELRANFILGGIAHNVVLSGLTLGRHWVTVNFGNAQSLELYVDSVLADSDAGYTVGINTNLRTMLVGAVNLGAGAVQFIDGRMAHLQVYGRRLTPAEISYLSFPAFAAGGGSSSEVQQEILNRAPKTYFAFDSAVATDLGTAGLSVTETGAVTKTDGWALAAGSFLQIPHSTAFETDSGLANGWVDSEVCVRISFRFPTLVGGPLVSKGNGARFDGGWWVDVEADGSVTWINAQQKKQVEVMAPPGAIQPNTWNSVILLFGRRGVQMYINSSSCEDGFSRPLCWEGWDHRYRGAIGTDGTSGAVVGGARWVNQFPLRIGHNSWSTGTNTVHVRDFAVFVSGGTNANPWTRTGTRFAQADVTAISGVPPIAPLKSVWHQGATINVATTDNIHTRFASAVPGSTLVLAAGVHTPTGDLTIPHQVRITGAGKTATIIAFPSGARFINDTSVWTNYAAAPATNIAAGATSWTVPVGHGFINGDILFIGTSILHETDVSGGSGGAISTAMRRSQAIEILDAGSTILSFRQPAYAAFNSAQRTSAHRLRPGIKHTYIDNLKVTTNGNAVAWVGTLIAGAVDIRLRNVDIVQTNTGLDRHNLRLDCVCSGEFLDSSFQNESNDEGPDPNHAYNVSIWCGGSHVFMNCAGGTEGWQDAFDRQFSNSGVEIGNQAGPTGILTPNVHVVTVDTSWQMQNNNFFPSPTSTDRQVSLGGHEAVDRRDICSTVLKGTSHTRFALGSEMVGVDAGQRFMRMAGGRHSYVHHWRTRNESSDQMYQSFGGEPNLDMYISSVVFAAGGSNSAKHAGTYTRCRFVNCSTPTPV